MIKRPHFISITWCSRSPGWCFISSNEENQVTNVLHTTNYTYRCSSQQSAWTWRWIGKQKWIDLNRCTVGHGVIVGVVINVRRWFIDSEINRCWCWTAGIVGVYSVCRHWHVTKWTAIYRTIRKIKARRERRWNSPWNHITSSVVRCDVGHIVASNNDLARWCVGDTRN